MADIYERYGASDQSEASAQSGSIYDRYFAREGNQDSPQEGGGILDTVLDVVGTPGRMTAGAVRAIQDGESVLARIAANRPTVFGGTQEDDFDDVLAARGYEDSAGRRLTGLAGDLVLDPLNLLGGGLVKGAAKVGAKVAGATGLTRLANAAADTSLVQSAAKRLIPLHGLDKFKTTVETTTRGGDTVAQELSYKDLRRLHNSRRRFVRDDARTTLATLFKGVNEDEAYEIAAALDKGQELANPRLESIRLKAKDLLEGQFSSEVGAGIINPATKQENYITHLVRRRADEAPTVGRELNARNPFQKRKAISFEQGVSLGIFEPDVRKIMDVRMTRGARAVVDARFINDTYKQFGRKMGAKEAAAQGYASARLSADSGFKRGLKGVYLPKEIAADLEKLQELPKQGDAISGLYGHATQLWKGYATRANIGFHVRNAVGNMIQAWMAGVGDTGTKILDPAILVAKHAQAARALARPETIPDIGRYSGDEIRHALREYGVVGISQSVFDELDELSQAAHQSTRFRSVNPLSRNNALLRTGAHIGNSIENTSRIAIFLDQLEKGRTLEQAALHVRKYLYDYQEITEDVRKVRDRLIPFATWYTKNLPQQLENIVTQPDKIAAVEKAFDAVEDTAADRGSLLDPASVPAWMKDYIQLPTQTSEGDVVFLNPALPLQDINKLEPTLDNAERNGLAMLNPIVRAPLELVVNRQFGTRSRLYDPRLGPTDDYRRANPLVGAIANISPEAAEMFGAVDSHRGTTLPVATDHLMRQLPPVSVYGRALEALTRPEGEDSGSALGVDLDLLQNAGLSIRPVSRQEAAMARKRNVQTETASRKAAAKRAPRRLTKPELMRLYDRYLKETTNGRP